MSGFEQHVEAPDRRWQYLLFAAEPYETISFKVTFISLLLSSSSSPPLVQIPSREVDKSEGKFWTYYNTETKQVCSFFSRHISSSLFNSFSFNFHSNLNRTNIQAAIILHRIHVPMDQLHRLHLVHYVVKSLILLSVVLY